MNVSQGYPLWAVDGAGKAHAVVGWDEYGYPELVPLDGSAGGVLSRRDEAGYTFTTTDPTARPDPNREAYEHADLRQRLTALADWFDRHSDAAVRASAHRIRQELAK